MKAFLFLLIFFFVGDLEKNGTDGYTFVSDSLIIKAPKSIIELPDSVCKNACKGFVSFKLKIDSSLQISRWNVQVMRLISANKDTIVEYFDNETSHTVIEKYKGLFDNFIKTLTVTTSDQHPKEASILITVKLKSKEPQK